MPVVFSKVSVEVVDQVATLRLNHPPLNILDIAMLGEIRQAVEGLRGEPLKALVIQTEGEHFSAGADVAEHLPEQAAEMIRAFHGALEAVLDFPAPTLAVVRGSALGGGMELMLACDFALAAEDARLGQPEIKLAVFPPLAAVLLPRLIPARRAWELILTGRTLKAAEAFELGLVNQVAPADALARETGRFLGRLTGLSGPALRLAKRALQVGPEWREELREVERLYLDELMREPDAVEGLKAFLEKRTPNWR